MSKDEFTSMIVVPKVRCNKCGNDYANVAGLIAHLKRVHLLKDASTKNWQELNIPDESGSDAEPVLESEILEEAKPAFEDEGTIMITSTF
jgi:hypothetical protein